MNDREIGTLRELNVQPGDVVEYVSGSRSAKHYAGTTWRCLDRHPKGHTEKTCVYYEKGSENGYLPADNDTWQFRIISRAAIPPGHARLPSGAVVDLTAITTPFGLLDAETKEALRAHGGPIEFYSGTLGWVFVDVAGGWSRNVYRVKPQPPAPVIGEVLMYTGAPRDWGWTADNCPRGRTHSLTLPTRDGQLVPGDYTGPDGLTIKVVSL